MEQERLMILKMLEEGKITAEEAAALLEALEQRPAEPPPGESAVGGQVRRGPEEARGDVEDRKGAEGRTDWTRRIEEIGRAAEEAGRRLGEGLAGRGEEIARRGQEIARRGEKLGEELARRGEEFAKRGEEFGRRIGEAVEELGRRIEEGLTKGRWWSRGLQGGGRIFGIDLGLDLPGLGERFRFEEERVGTFEAERPRIEIDVRSGDVTVEGWDRQEFRLVADKQVRALTRAEAQARAAGVLDVEATGGGLRVQAREALGARVDLRLWLPQELVYDLDIHTTNGRAECRGIRGDQVEMFTTNGRLRVDDAVLRRADLGTGNGAITLYRVRAEDLEARTANGSLTTLCDADRCSLRAVNGSVTYKPWLEKPNGTPSDLQGAAPGGQRRVELATTNGAIDVVLPSPWPKEAGLRIEASSRFGRIRLGTGPEAASGAGAGSVGSGPVDSEPGGQAAAGAGSNGPALREVVRQERLGSNRVVAETPGFDGAAMRVYLEATTVNGAIRIHPSPSGEEAEQER